MLTLGPELEHISVRHCSTEVRTIGPPERIASGSIVARLQMFTGVGPGVKHISGFSSPRPAFHLRSLYAIIQVHALTQEFLSGGVQARRPENSLDNVSFFFWSPQLNNS